MGVDDRNIVGRLARIRAAVIDGDALSAVVIVCSNSTQQVLYGRYFGQPLRRAPVLEMPRTVGSTLKVALYSAYLENFPKPLTTPFVDEPTPIRWKGKILMPQNSDSKYRGEVTLEYAFANSINTVALKIAQELGTLQLASYLRACGISQSLPDTPLLALGPLRLTGIELLATLVPVINKGRAYPLAFKLTVRERAAIRESPRVLSSYTVELMRRLMRSSVEFGTARYLSKHRGVPGGKTGTSEDCRDLWFMGAIDEDLFGLVWLGKTDGSRISSRDNYPASAARFAVPVWSEVVSTFSSRERRAGPANGQTESIKETAFG